MLLDIRNAVDPLSRGLLVDAFEPDYPPLSYACDVAHQQGGTVIWCHNGQGMEAPVAAALGKIDAFNLFDPYWNNAEYDIYYQMLNAGIKLPASTGSDWYICSSNRVYSWTGNTFEYGEWLDSFKRGQTFITNGPSLQIHVGDSQPGDEIESKSGERIHAQVQWTSHYPIQIIELVQNGEVVGSEKYPNGSTKGIFKMDVNLEFDGWIAARLFSSFRDSYLQPQFAHTSPIYVKTGLASAKKTDASLKFVQQIEESLEWVRRKGRFYNDYQRQEIETLFREAQDIYRGRASENP